MRQKFLFLVGEQRFIYMNTEQPLVNKEKIKAVTAAIDPKIKKDPDAAARAAREKAAKKGEKAGKDIAKLMLAKYSPPDTKPLKVPDDLTNPTLAETPNIALKPVGEKPTTIPLGEQTIEPLPAKTSANPDFFALGTGREAQAPSDEADAIAAASLEARLQGKKDRIVNVTSKGRKKED